MLEPVDFLFLTVGLGFFSYVTFSNIKLIYKYYNSSPTSSSSPTETSPSLEAKLGDNRIIIDPNVESEYLTSVGWYYLYQETDFVNQWLPSYPLMNSNYSLENFIKDLAEIFPDELVLQIILSLPWNDILPEIYEIWKELK